MMRGRSIIGLDLDGVVADYTAAMRSFVAEYKSVETESLPEPVTYNLVKAGWGIDSGEEFLRIHSKAVASGLYANMPVMSGASEALRQLSDMGAHIRIVTHRLIMGGSHKRIVSDTATWLDQNEIPYMSLCFTGLKDSVGAHVYIEDSPDNISALRLSGTDVIVFDQPYNRAISGPRLMSWADGVPVISEFLEKNGQYLS
ncbi:5' nucleotidase, NT5C type [Corynebacterium amycolatum]|uniref:5'-nucleotidase n=1 Tax=Corynebacterium amycolatum TaxID=43765 RepID=A0AAW9SL21_CORAY|nr:hypothetical protein [Corynebacterium amycolatum]MDK7237742.1 hypothetical protein [Corynebacterium amycolatum]MDK7247706.1 hypothetical protein [Corynebacterium amycolatum]MEB2596683.1 hypothetical protein [Corynebacterium amycolatum]